MAKIFDHIAPVFDLLYHRQRKGFKKSLDQAASRLELDPSMSFIDLGCGTGALTSVFRDRGLQVTGVDLSKKMIEYAARRPENKSIQFIHADASGQLPFPDKSFDVAFASFVAHGMKGPERMALYQEMKRLAKQRVIIRDYNSWRHPLISLIEWAERGDYFQFINVAEAELTEVFGPIQVLEGSRWSSWYVCDPT